jgi:hypothetical protein
VLLPWQNFWEIVAANPAGKVRLVHRQRARNGGLDVAFAAVDGNSLLASGAATVSLPAPQAYGQNVTALIGALNRNVSIVRGGASGTTLIVQ